MSFLTSRLLYFASLLTILQISTHWNIIITISFLEKNMNSRDLVWKTSGLFNNVELGLDDLLSPGISNCFENSGNWLLGSNFSKSGYSTPENGNSVALRDLDEETSDIDNYHSSVSTSDSAKGMYDLSATPDCVQHQLPESQLNELEFEESICEDINMDDLIIFPPHITLPPPCLSDAPSPNLFENLLDLGSLIENQPAEERGSLDFTGVLFYLPESTSETISAISKVTEIQNDVESSFGDLGGLLGDVIDRADESEPTFESDSSKSTKEFCDKVIPHGFPDHSYSLGPLGGMSNDTKELNDFTADDPVESVDFPSAFDGTEDHQPGITASSSSSPILPFKSFNLSTMDLKFLEQLMAGDDKVLDPEIGLSGKTSKSPKSKSKPISKKGICSGSPKKEDPRLTEDELMEENETNVDETRKKYLERRRKNNIASRRSREIRKIKYSEMEQKAMQLELENKRLKEKIAKMEILTAQMKETLIARLRKS